MLPFKFVDEFPPYDSNSVFYVRVNPEINDTDELMTALSYSLWFPRYFGGNWNAFYDCLLDFSWMSLYKIVVVHEKIPMISEEDLRIYLEILYDSVRAWKDTSRVYAIHHELEIVFMVQDQPTVEKWLEHYPSQWERIHGK